MIMSIIIFTIENSCSFLPAGFAVAVAAVVDVVVNVAVAVALAVAVAVVVVVAADYRTQ